MIEKGKFALSDVRSMRDINLQQNWIQWFKPGQRVQMSMIFQKKFLDAANNCPSCGNANETPLDDEAEWYVLPCMNKYLKIPDTNWSWQPKVRYNIQANRGNRSLKSAKTKANNLRIA